MIQFADTNTTPLVRSMWKTCFDDTDVYMDLHFTKKYKPENTLLYFEGDICMAALQMLPYSIRFYQQIVPFYYLAGLCTLPEYRNRGCMGQLIKASFEVMKERNVALCGLVPADGWLFDYYAKYGFETVFDASDPMIDLSSILQKSNDLKESYDLFDKQYQRTDFTVLKSLSDFDAIVSDYKDEGCPIKGNLKGMARILLPEVALGIYASANDTVKFEVEIEEEVFKIENGKVSKTNSSASHISVDINLLTRLLFAYRISELDSNYGSLFKEHHPIINLMLE